MRTMLVLVVLALLGVPPTFAQSGSAIAPESPYKQRGATLLSPGDRGWYLAQATGDGIVFGRQYGSKNETAIIHTTIIRIEGFEEDKSFLEYIAREREKQDDKTRFRILDISNEYASFKGSSCLKYRTLSEDHKDQGIDSPRFQYLKTFGYVCRHPLKRVIAFQMEVSHRGRDKAFPAALLSVGEEFFNNVQFNGQGLEE